MIRLVVNADDLGLASEIDEGIIDAARNGIVTSASALVMGRSFDAARILAAETELGLGIHLAACGGLRSSAPPNLIPTLAPRGVLPRSWRHLAMLFLRHPRVAREVLVEFEGQLARARDCRVQFDHVDAHQHLHVWPPVFAGAVRLCRRFGVRALRVPAEAPGPRALRRPVRAIAMVPLAGLAAAARLRLDGLTAPRFWGLYDGGGLDRRALLALLCRLPEGDHEIGCHPGQGVSGVPEDPTWRFRWDAERLALCDPDVRRMVERRGIRLCRYSELLR